MPATMLPSDKKTETLIMSVYPSISADGPGRLIGRTFSLFPLPFVNHNSLGASLVGLVLLPITIGVYTLGALAGLGGYVASKVIGDRYVLTNRALQIWSSLGQRLKGEVTLEQIAEVEVHQKKGQAFYHAADVIILDAGGNPILTLAGVPRAEVFRQTIIKARDARIQVSAALAVIGARSSG